MSEISKSTKWWRENKEKATVKHLARLHTIPGKLTNLITTSRYRCKKSGLEHTIDTKYLNDLYVSQKGLCAISGKEMIIRGKNCAADSPYSISLDRIDSDKGYVHGNVWLVCTGINLMKARLTMDQFIDFCKSTVEKFK